MTPHELDLEIAKREGGKKQVDIAQIKEVRKIIARLIFENPYALGALIESGKVQKEFDQSSELKLQDSGTKVRVP